MAERRAQYLGIDLSTTAVSVGVRAVDGAEDFVALAMRGATRWHGQPAFRLDYLPTMLAAVLWQLQDRGWRFDEPGNLSFSVRQHDMVLMDRQLDPLMPALSWECHVAEHEVAQLQQLGVDRQVGPIAARFVLPKLMWALTQDPGLANRVHYVATTGDYLSARLTGELKLSTSDALSNGLLDQRSKKLAVDALSLTPVDPEWFPSVTSSGSLVGKVFARAAEDRSDWGTVREILAGWSVAAGLGDNHAGAVGCGLASSDTIVVSAGSSGTVVRICQPTADLVGKANCFEYYDDRLLLMMLADCAIWYNRFLRGSGDHRSQHETLNESAERVDPSEIQRVRQEEFDGQTQEVYPSGWNDLAWDVQVASTQFSIAAELLGLVKEILDEVKGAADSTNRFVLTGGLCQSPFVRSVLYTGLREIQPSASVLVSDRNDRLAFQSATYGALINAAVLGDYSCLAERIRKWCPQVDCEPPTADRQEALSKCLSRWTAPGA